MPAIPRRISSSLSFIGDRRSVGVYAVRLEFGNRSDRTGEPGGFLQSRPWLVVGFFALLGGN